VRLRIDLPDLILFRAKSLLKLVGNVDASKYEPGLWIVDVDQSL
jgi:hypothetical protein